MRCPGRISGHRARRRTRRLRRRLPARDQRPGCAGHARDARWRNAGVVPGNRRGSDAVRTPLVAAMGAATVHERSGGRLILGLGTGDAGVGALDELRETIGQIRTLLDGETLELGDGPQSLSLPPTRLSRSGSPPSAPGRCGSPARSRTASSSTGVRPSGCRSRGHASPKAPRRRDAILLDHRGGVRPSLGGWGRGRGHVVPESHGGAVRVVSGVPASVRAGGPRPTGRGRRAGPPSRATRGRPRGHGQGGLRGR